jgi:hypothetical protein
MKKTACAAFAMAMLLSSTGVNAQASYYMRQHLTGSKAPVVDGQWNYGSTFDYGSCSAGTRTATILPECFVSGKEVDHDRCRPGIKPPVKNLQYPCYNTCTVPATPGALAGQAFGSVAITWSDMETMRAQALVKCEGIDAPDGFVTRACNLYVNGTTNQAKANIASSPNALSPTTPAAGFVAWHGTCSKSG